jgi:uncharacterized protein YndB with AHSA1/START domain
MPVKNDSVPKSTEPEFLITRVFDAPRELVFKAWTDPKHLAQWWGPRAFTTPICEMDLRPGGAYRIVMRSADGVDYPIKGVFRQIVEPQRIVMTQDVSGHPEEWYDFLNPGRAKGDYSVPGEMLATVTFDDLGGKTRLTVRTLFKSAAIRDAMLKLGMTEGWSQSLERLSELLAGVGTVDREIVISRIFDAPRELVWRAMTDPQHVIHWWGPRGFTNTIREMDVRPGGVWKHIMHGPDGVDYPNSSVFKEVVKPQRIVFSHGGGKKGEPDDVQFVATWTFDAMNAGAQTRVTIHMVFPTAADRDRVVKEYGAIEGGKQTLARLAEHLPRMG